MMDQLIDQIPIDEPIIEIKIDIFRMGIDGDMQFFEVKYGDNRDEN